MKNDNLTHPLGNPQEGMLKKALEVLEKEPDRNRSVYIRDYAADLQVDTFGGIFIR